VNYPEDFINKIICGDCLEVMENIPDNSIDLILTDPVYQKLEDYKFLFSISSSILKPSGQLICYFADMYLPDLLKFPFGELKWVKLIVERNVGTKGTLWKYHCKTGCKHAMWFFKSPFPKDIEWTTDFIYSKPDGNNVKHQWGKNYPSIYELIKRHTHPNDIILDPFFGSGTVGRACKLLNRRFIGIEISPEYCKIAEERLKKVPKRLDKFINGDFIPKEKIILSGGDC